MSMCSRYRVKNKTQRYINISGDWRLVDVYPVVLFDYPQLDIFVQKRSKYWWHISEGSTGLKVFDGYTRTEVINTLVDFLDKRGVGIFEETVRKGIGKTGLSPDYEVVKKFKILH